MDQLKFVVLDEEDLEIVSAHLQDAVAKVSDVMWRPTRKARGAGGQSFRLGKRARPPSRNTTGGGPRCVSSGCCPANAGT